EQALQKLTNPIAKASFDRIEPVVEKPLRCLDFRLRQVTSRGIACHGVISAGASTPESLVGPSWRLRRLHFPTTPATAPASSCEVRRRDPIARARDQTGRSLRSDRLPQTVFGGLMRRLRDIGDNVVQNRTVARHGR